MVWSRIGSLGQFPVYPLQPGTTNSNHRGKLKNPEENQTQTYNACVCVERVKSICKTVSSLKWRAILVDGSSVRSVPSVVWRLRSTHLARRLEATLPLPRTRPIWLDSWHGPQEDKNSAGAGCGFYDPAFNRTWVQGLACNSAFAAPNQYKTPRRFWRPKTFWGTRPRSRRRSAAASERSPMGSMPRRSSVGLLNHKSWNLQAG